MTRSTDPLFDQRIANWLDEDPQHAPGSLLGTVLAAIPSTPQRRASRVPWGSGRGRGLTLLAAAALLLVGGAVAAGSGLLRLPSVVPPVPEPAPSLAAVAPPSPAAETPSPVISPSPVPTATPAPVPPRAPSWAATASMITPRSDFAAVPLPDGKVLAVGGMNGNTALASAELYDPVRGTWTATGTMGSHAGSGFTTTLLRDGRVLVAGGASAELYDPATGTWTTTGNMLTPRAGHSATLLSDGAVLVAGGALTWSPQASAELYDPATGTWAATGSMGTGRWSHSATLLSDGRVLVAGGVVDPSPESGSVLASAELYDQGSGTWTYARSMVSGNYRPSSALLPDGRVLMGGVPPQLYDPVTLSWTAAGGKAIASFNGPAVLLANGGALALGAAKPGQAWTNATDLAAYLFDPGAGSWTPAGMMDVHRAGYTVTPLPDGRVLVAGGSDPDAVDGNAALASAEVFDPGTWSPSPIALATPAPSSTSYAARPDGSMFAYIQERRLWVANSDGTGAHQLLPDLVGNPGTPAWSPDGTRLVFPMTPDGDNSGASHLYLTDASGSTPQLVDTGCVAPCVRDTDPAFSSDGTKLVFVRALQLPPITKQNPSGTDASVLATIDLSTGQVIELASTKILGRGDRNPRWSPDGTQIVSTQDAPGGPMPEINGVEGPNWPMFLLFVVDADGGNLHQLSGAGELGDWSPDGTRIVFESPHRPVPIPNSGKGTGYSLGPNVDIATIRPDGTDLRQVTSDHTSGAPSWTADGRIWFEREFPKDHIGLWIMDADGSNATQASLPPQLLEELLWNPPGRPSKP